jgi:hypothetical protein
VRTSGMSERLKRLIQEYCICKVTDWSIILL